MVLCKICNLEKPLRKDGFCSLSCFNKTKIKKIDGYKKCLLCEKEFPFRNSLVVRSGKSKIHGLIGSCKQIFCSKDCSIQYRNKFKNPAKIDSVRKKMSVMAKIRGTEHMRTPKARERQRKSITGKRHWNWQGGKTGEIRKIRNSFLMKQWRFNVFERDNYTCILCNARNGNGYTVKLNADHIKSFSNIIKENKIKSFKEAILCKELWDINNGRTLCLNCHKNTDSFGGKSNKFSNLSKL